MGVKSPLSGANTTTISSIADLVSIVKQFDPQYAPNPSSRIVNPDGTPKIMYHGTRAENGEFYVFDASKAVRKGGLGLMSMGKGNYFTAKQLDGTERYGSRVIAAYLDIKKPFVYNGGSSLMEQAARSLPKPLCWLRQGCCSTFDTSTKRSDHGTDNSNGRLFRYTVQTRSAISRTNLSVSHQPRQGSVMDFP